MKQGFTQTEKATLELQLHITEPQFVDTFVFDVVFDNNSLTMGMLYCHFEPLENLFQLESKKRKFQLQHLIKPSEPETMQFVDLAWFSRNISDKFLFQKSAFRLFKVQNRAKRKWQNDNLSPNDTRPIAQVKISTMLLTMKAWTHGRLWAEEPFYCAYIPCSTPPEKTGSVGSRASIEQPSSVQCAVCLQLAVFVDILSGEPYCHTLLDCLKSFACSSWSELSR